MKRCCEDFAIVGGQPVFATPIAVGRPNLRDTEQLVERLRDVLCSGQLTNDGPVVREFEQRICEHLSVSHCITVCNGTTALQVMAVATGLTGEVIVPSFTFIATAHALQWVGLQPVFADVDNTTHTLDPDSAEACISPATSAILGVHLWGHACDAGRLRSLADRHGLALLFDASHAFGSTCAGVPVGRLGDAAAFSFHATKIVHAIEGGAIVTDDAELAERCRLIRNFGITGYTQIRSIGTNAKMNELCAAAGVHSLQEVDCVIRHNRRNLQAYIRQMASIPGLHCLTDDQAETNAQYVVVRVSDEFGLTRNQLVDILRAEGIFARCYFAPGCHRAPPYSQNSKCVRVPLPVTEKLLQDTLQLPTGLSVDTETVESVVAVLRDVRRHADQLRRLVESGNVCRHPFDPENEVVRSHAA